MTDLAKPDWCILDLDPKGAPFADVVTIAKAIHRLCAQGRLPQCYVKTSGSTGLHVLLPMAQQVHVRTVARVSANSMARIVEAAAG